MGGVYNRFKWRKFRKNFYQTQKSPLLNYHLYRNINSDTVSGAKSVYRLSGSIESITDGHTLWVRSEDLTLPVSLEKTKCYLLPENEGDEEPNAPSQIRWNRVSALSEGVKVFVAGVIKTRDNRQSFSSTRENPLTVIFYSCPDDELTEEIIRAARIKGEYWNSLTPASIVIGALSLIVIASLYLGRPAFHLAVISSLIAVFIPVYPILPPGFLLTLIYQRVSRNARKTRIKCDFALFDLIPGETKESVKHYAVKAYSLEVIAWIIMLAGIAINIVFIFLILSLFQVVSF